MYILNTEKSILDSLKSHPYINEHINIEYYTDPFNHIRLTNVFNAEIYQSLCDNFMAYINRTTPYKDQPGAVHDYAGYIYGMRPEDCVNGYEFFIDPSWRQFSADTFNIELNQHTALSAHWHKAPAKPGFVHRDLNIVCNSPAHDENIKLTGEVYYSDDSIDYQPNTQKMIRSVALLFYLNNKDHWEPSDKGGTSIYSGWNFDTFIKEVPPENNSIFIFEVCPNSFHGFSGSNFDRSSMVQWFHSSPAYQFHRHLSLTKEYHKKFKASYERWNPKNNPWPIENDQEYSKYFNKPFYESLNEE
jgi:hypothetical protein